MKKGLKAVVALAVVTTALSTTGCESFLDINQIRGAQAPQVSTTQNGIVTKGGQAPAFDVQTGSVTVGSNDPPGSTVFDGCIPWTSLNISQCLVRLK